MFSMHLLDWSLGVSTSPSGFTNSTPPYRHTMAASTSQNTLIICSHCGQGNNTLSIRVRDAAIHFQVLLSR